MYKNSRFLDDFVLNEPTAGTLVYQTNGDSREGKQVRKKNMQKKKHPHHRRAAGMACSMLRDVVSGRPKYKKIAADREKKCKTKKILSVGVSFQSAFRVVRVQSILFLPSLHLCCMAHNTKSEKPIFRTNPRLFLRTTFRNSTITPASPLIKKSTTLRSSLWCAH